MNLPISFAIALRYWRAKSADRFGLLVGRLAGFGILLGVMALIIVLSIMNGLENYQKQQVLADIPHAQISATAPIDLNAPLPTLPAFVQKAVAINRTKVIYQTSSSISAGEIIGIQQFSDDPLVADIPEDSFQNILPEGGFKLIIGQALAQQLNVAIGDKIRVMVSENSQYTPFGRVPMQRLFTVSDIYPNGAEASSYEAFANLQDIGRLMRIAPNQAQGYRLFLSDPFLITELPQTLGDAYQITDWREQKGEFFQAVRMEKNMMGLLISLIIVVAISNIVTSLSLMVVDKQGEIAILQTQGLRKAQVRNIFIFQGFLVGLNGTILGAFLGILAVLNLHKILALVSSDMVFLPTQLDGLQIAIVVLFSLFLSFLSTIYPAYRAAQTEPAAALRYE